MKKPSKSYHQRPGRYPKYPQGGKTPPRGQSAQKACTQAEEPKSEIGIFHSLKLQADLLVPTRRLKYCTHERSLGLPPDHPILVQDNLQGVDLWVCQLSEVGLSAVLERFEAEQPALSALRYLVPGVGAEAWEEPASANLALLLASIHLTFQKHFPAPEVSTENLLDIAREIQDSFQKAEVCVCERYQGVMMRSIVNDVETLINEGILMPVQGNLIAMVTIIAIQALDEAAALAWLDPGATTTDAAAQKKFLAIDHAIFSNKD